MLIMNVDRHLVCKLLVLHSMSTWCITDSIHRPNKQYCTSHMVCHMTGPHSRGVDHQGDQQCQQAHGGEAPLLRRIQAGRLSRRLPLPTKGTCCFLMGLRRFAAVICVFEDNQPACRLQHDTSTVYLCLCVCLPFIRNRPLLHLGLLSLV